MGMPPWATGALWIAPTQDSFLHLGIQASPPDLLQKLLIRFFPVHAGDVVDNMVALRFGQMHGYHTYPISDRRYDSAPLQVAFKRLSYEESDKVYETAMNRKSYCCGVCLCRSVNDIRR